MGKCGRGGECKGHGGPMPGQAVTRVILRCRLTQNGSEEATVASLPRDCQDSRHLSSVLSGTMNTQKAEPALLSLFSLERKQESRKWIVQGRHIADYLVSSLEFRKLVNRKFLFCAMHN